MSQKIAKGRESKGNSRLPSYYFKQEDKQEIFNILKKDFPESVNTIIRAADKTVSRIYEFHHSIKIFKNGINWNYFPPPHRDLEWMCALNRHDAWVVLAKAYMLTKNQKYLKELIVLINSWIDSNPYPRPLKVHPADGYYVWELLNTARRATNWVFVYYLLLGNPLFDKKTKEKMKNSLKEHGEYLYKYYKQGPQNNWVIMEMEGLLNISIMFPEFPESKKWKKTAVKVMIENFYQNVYDDGVQFEMSPNYHTGCLKWYGRPLILCMKNRIKLPAKFVKVYKKMFYFILHLRMPDGTIPAFGDSSYGEKYNEALTLGAVLFKDGYLKRTGSFDSEMLWLFGKAELEEYRKVKEETPAELETVFNKGGFYISRTGWNKNSDYLAFDCGPVGGGHGHSDLLSFCLAIKGKSVFIDPGTFTYVGNKWRKYFKSTAAHNTVTVDDKDQVEYIGSWSWGKTPTYKMIKCGTNEKAVIFVGEHYGYKRLKDPVTHRREIIFNKQSCFLIHDKFSAKGIHEYKQYFHLVPSKITKKGNTILITTREGCRLKMSCFNNEKVSIKKGWISPSYNIKFKSPVICISKVIKGTGSISTLINY